MKKYNKITDKDIIYLREICGSENVFIEDAIHSDFTHDEMIEYGCFMPDVVVEAHTTEQVSQIMKYANENNIPVTPRGSGTGVITSYSIHYTKLYEHSSGVMSPPVTQLSANSFKPLRQAVVNSELNGDVKSPYPTELPDALISAIVTTNGSIASLVAPVTNGILVASDQVAAPSVNQNSRKRNNFV